MVYKIYARNGYKKFFDKEIKNTFFYDSLRVYSVLNGTIVVDSKQKFAVFDSNKNIVSKSTQMLNKIAQDIPKYAQTNDFLDIEAVYLGNLESHFGHFLLEHTNRFYPLLNNKYKNKKYIIVNNKQLSNVAEFVWDFLEILGVSKDDVYIINSSTKIRKLYIPDVAFEIPNHSSFDFAKIFNAMVDNVNSSSRYDKIYVSRLRLGERSTFGEEQIQNIFAKNGFKIIYPEQLSLKKQIQYMKNCKCLAGIAGSALHLALFMPKGGNVIQIKRNKLLADNANIQYIICQTKGCDFTLVDCAMEKLPTHHWSDFPQIIGPTKFFIQFMKDFGFKYSNADVEYNKTEYANYKCAFRNQGGFLRYQIKRMLVFSIPRLIPMKRYKSKAKIWLSKHL